MRTQWVYGKIHIHEAFPKSGYAMCGSSVHRKDGKVQGIVH